ncbi:MAG: hypothetical protein ACTHU0_09715 [Kofleriaceae bacterium]
MSLDNLDGWEAIAQRMIRRRKLANILLVSGFVIDCLLLVYFLVTS